MNNSLLLDILNIVEKTSINCHKWIGKGDNVAADKCATDLMRLELNKLKIKISVSIGEGERDNAPMLYIGEQLGMGVEEFEIAVDPLEGTSLCAKGQNGSMSVIAIGRKNTFVQAPDVYMEKIVIGAQYPEDTVKLSLSPKENLSNLAKFKKCNVDDLKVIVLNRERHTDLINDIREAGAKIILIEDGDISASILAASNDNDVDMYIGIGGAPEGVLAASALKCIGGHMFCKFIFQNEDQKSRAKKLGIKNLDAVYSVNDLVKGDVIFAASGITDGDLVSGVKKGNGYHLVETLLMDSSQKKILTVKSKILE
ncbi:MAG: fructose-1,6-bisphosphatase class II [Candidatus Midichloriaceae bacterium]|jgi:fructose-1,6-bisphosphatase class II